MKQAKLNMAKNTAFEKPGSLRKKLIAILEDFEGWLQHGGLRKQVLELIPAFHALQELGISLVRVRNPDAKAGRDRILYYLREYPRTPIDGEELFVVAGVQEYGRRVRELRVELGWKVVSGKTVAEMLEEGDVSGNDFNAELSEMKADDYILLDTERDREAAYRWNVANEIRRKDLSAQDSALAFLRENVGKPVTGEELRYVANEAQSWPRRTRELRTEQGWPVKTKNTGRSDLPVGTYILEKDRQNPPHDRDIKDRVRMEVLGRDSYRCCNCEWSYDNAHPDDPRSLLEFHHVKHHVEGGKNNAKNLLTLCNVCHDEVHSRGNLSTPEALFEWIGRDAR
jgi:5-methylcytosine-specific restriction endonuclease McrA